MNLQTKLDPLSNKSLVDHSLNSTVAFVAKDEKNLNQLYCSGVFITPTIIMSARHCFVGNLAVISMLSQMFGPKFVDTVKPDLYKEMMTSTFQVATYKEFSKDPYSYKKTLKTMDAKIVYVSLSDFWTDTEYEDLVLLKVEQKNASPYWSSISVQDVQIGEHLFSVGMPIAKPWLVSNKWISQEKYFGKYKAFYYVDGFIAGGMSGGPLFDTNGNVVGIAHAVFSETRQGNLGLYISTPTLRKYLKIAKTLE